MSKLGSVERAYVAYELGLDEGRKEQAAEIERLRAALEHTREVIALFYALEPLSDDGKKQLLKLRDVLDNAIASEEGK